MPAPIPAPLPPWARALLQLAPLISVGLQSALDYIGTISDGTDPTPSEWRHFQLVGSINGSTTSSDRFVTTMDVVNITGGGVDNTWNDADYATVWGAIDTLMTQWASRMSSSYTWLEVRAYRRMFNDYSIAEPFVKSGAPERVIPTVRIGTANTGELPPQCSITSTDRTVYARHWGRNYWPHPAAGLVALSPPGNVTTAHVDSLATAVVQCYDTLMASEFYPVVPITMVQGVPTRGLLTVTEVQVDDLFDVIRRRRPKQPTHYKRLPV